MEDVWFAGSLTRDDLDLCIKALVLQPGQRGYLIAVSSYGDDAPRLVLASRALFQLFGVTDGEALSARLLTGSDPGSRRLAILQRTMPLENAPRLERLRFYINPGSEVVTFLCRRICVDNESSLFVAAALGLRAGLLPERSLAGTAPVTSPHAFDGQAIAAKSVSELPAAASANGVGEQPLPDGPLDLPAIHAALSRRWPSRRTLRFLWQTDSNAVCIQVSPPLSEIVGPGNADLVGLSLLDLAPRLDPSGRLGNVLRSQETWSGVDVDWPIDGARAAVSIGLGAIPAFDPDRSFSGYRGYGIIKLDALVTHEPLRLAPDVAATGKVIAFPSKAMSLEDKRAFAALAAELRDRAGLNNKAPATAAPSELAPPPASTDEVQDTVESTEKISAATTDLDDHAEFDGGALAASTSVEAEPSQAPFEETEITFDGAENTDASPAPTLIERSDVERATTASVTEVDAPPQAPVKKVEVASNATADAEHSAFDEAATAPDQAEVVRSQTPANNLGITAHGSQNTGNLETSEASLEGARAIAGQDDDDTFGLLQKSTPESLSQNDLSRDKEVVRNGLALLDRLAVGLLVSRDNVPIFANRHLLDLTGFIDEDALHAAGGMAHLFGSTPGNASGAETVAVRTRTGTTLPATARLQRIDWNGLPATLLTLQGEMRAGRTETPDLTEAAKPVYVAASREDDERRELRAILETATDGVVVMDDECRVLSLNRAGEALFGRDRGEVIGRPFLDLFAPHDRDLARDYLEGVKSDATRSLLNDGREFLVTAAQGGPIPVFMTLGRLGPSRDASAPPKPARYCALFRDLTHWKKVEGELDEARRAAERASTLKSDFLAKVSHEIRTPLNAIIGFAEMMLEERFGGLGNERYKDYLRDIHGSGTHVMSLVNDLLDLSKIEAGRIELSPRAVDINRIVSECVARMQPQASRERVIMRLALAPNLPNITADERSLRQIVLNLLSNAVKFNEPGGQVIVASQLTEAGYAVLRIRDTGPGMSESDITAALEPFRQLSRPATSGAVGTGLGLPLTKALVEANEGALTIRSKVDQGTFVEVAFPPARVIAS